MPSVYPDSKLKFKEDVDFIVTSEEDYFQVLQKDIINVKTQNNGGLRPIIIVFEHLTPLKQFYDSKFFNDYRDQSQILTEETNPFHIKKIIDEATIEGYITLITKSLGRGTDFIIRDDSIIKSGGVHVCQTFYSQTKSEEIQIKGRTARQGDPGSYSLIILDETFPFLSLIHI